MKNPESIESSKTLQMGQAIADELTSLKSINTLSTNDVLKHQCGHHVTYYLPCYVRFLLKEIIQINKQTMDATVSGTLLFSFYYGNVNRKLIEQIVGKDKQKSILLQFNYNQSLQLREQKGITKRQDKQKKIIDFIVRMPFKVRMKGNVFWTPFITIDLYLAVVIQSISFYQLLQNHPEQQKEQKIVFKFNCMDSQRVILLPHGQLMTFGYYHIAPSLFQVKYTNSREYPFEHKSSHQIYQHIQNEDQDIKYFQYAHFKASIYQYPINSILTIFIPLWTTGLIGLLIFFFDVSFSTRISTIAVLVLAFVALIPTINSTIPPSPKIKMVDILVIMQLAATIVLTIKSFHIRNEDPKTYIFYWDKSTSFFIALLLNLLTFTAIVLLFIIHKLYWQPNYNKQKSDKKIKCKKIVRSMWQNKQCDTYFRQYFEKNHKSEIKNI